MKYKQFAQFNRETSILGFGCMRFPVTKQGKVDRQETFKMLQHALDMGINYFDTAYPYHDGQSEVIVGEFFKQIKHQDYLIADKLPSWLIKEQADFDRFFNEQLERLQRSEIDFYLVHTLNKEFWDNLSGLGVIEWLENLKKQGRIKQIGFSFHADLDCFKKIVDDYDWDFCQIQYNFVDIDYQAGLKGLNYAVRKNIPVIAMEPLLGGKLATPSQSITEIWDRAAVKRSAVEWALQWLWNQPEVTMVLSGMSSMEQLKENIQYADQAEENNLTGEELLLFDEVREKYKTLNPIKCTSCNYCMPCPAGVNIPVNFSLFNDGVAYNNPESSRGQYAWMARSHEMKIAETNEQAKNCIQCKKCEPKCPQNLPISQLMPYVHQVLGENKDYQISSLPR